MVDVCLIDKTKSSSTIPLASGPEERIFILKLFLVSEIYLGFAQCTSRSPLEQPWSLTAEEFTRRVGQV